MTTRRNVLATLVHAPAVLWREILEAGALAGLIGGVAMALFAAVYEAARGFGFWTPLEAIAATVLREPAVTGSVGELVLGLVVHLAVAIFIGILFALVTPRDVAPAPAIAFGLFAGLVALVVMSLVIVPVENPEEGIRLMWGTAPGALPVSIAFADHLLYGAGLALAPWLRRRIASTRGEAGT
jgi:hypothetical protein